MPSGRDMALSSGAAYASVTLRRSSLPLDIRKRVIPISRSAKTTLGKCSRKEDGTQEKMAEGLGSSAAL